MLYGHESFEIRDFGFFGGSFEIWGFDFCWHVQAVEYILAVLVLVSGLLNY